MEFKKQQREIIDMGVDFIRHSNQQVFQYDGDPGTGKSYVLYYIIKEAGYRMEEVLPMAYTGQAAIVMRTKGFYNAKSIHSSIYNIEDIIKKDQNNNPTMNTYFNAPRVESEFVPKQSLYGIKLIVIDEGYMVPDYMKADIERYGIKIIVTGDKGQLPPVKAKPAYLYQENIPHLSELVRQEEGSGIVYIARRIKQGLPVHCGRYGNVLVIEERDLNLDMIKMSDIVLCGRNKTRDSINKYVRENVLGIKSSLPVHGDRMICRKNNWNIEIDGISLANGLVGTVTSVPNVLDFDGKRFTIDFMPDLLNKSFHALNCDYKYFTAPPEEKNAIKASKYSIGEKFEYAYALTTHLTQGAEFNGGIYFEENMFGDIQKNLDYTAVTRFKKFLIYVKQNRIKYY